MMRRIPLRCWCGNAVLRPRQQNEDGARECVTSLCPVCDTGDFEETFYTDRSGRLRTCSEWMDPAHDAHDAP